MVDWTRVRHFSRGEWVHGPDLIHPDVVYMLDEQRDAHARAVPGVRYLVHVAWDSSGHAAGSAHYARGVQLATAVDYHMELNGAPLPLVDQWLFAERFPWVGIGLYPYWENPGLHCDLRPVGAEHPNLGKRWWRDRAGAYRALDRGFLVELVHDVT